MAKNVVRLGAPAVSGHLELFTTKQGSLSALLALLLIAGPFLAIPNHASADTTGAVFPTTGVNDTSTGSRSWSNPARITADDGSFSQSQTLSNGQTFSNYLRGTGYNFAGIPSDATINGIQMTVERKGSSGNVLTDSEVRLYSPSVGTTTSKADTTTLWSSSQATVSYGGASDLWGASWTPADLQSSSFKALFAAKWSTGGSSQASVDFITITVTYTPAAGPVDTTDPVLSQITPVPTPGADSTPDYTFSSDEAGTITYSGDCSSASSVAVVGNNTVTFNSLADGAHTNCTVTVTDAATNASLPLAVSAFTIDTTGPDVSLSTLSSTPTRDGTVEFTALFTESVSDFQEIDLTDIVIGNGTLQALSLSGSGTTYTFTVLPTIDGLVTIDIPSGVAHDALGNSNTAAMQYTFTYDTTAPGVTITSGPTEGEYINNDGVSIGFDVSGGAVTIECDMDGDGFVACTSPQSYTGLDDGEHTFSVRATDAATNTATADVTFTVDMVAPELELTTTSNDPTNLSPIPVTAEFNENVTGFDDTDLTIVGGSASNFVAVDGDTYTFDLTPSGEGTITVDVDVASAEDLAQNDNEAADQFEITYDITPPTLTVDDGPVDGEVTDATVAWAFTAESGAETECDVDAAGFAACTTSGSHNPGTLTEGSHTFTVRAIDDAGNVTTAPTINFTVDDTAPTITEVTPVTTPTQDTTPEYTFNMTEDATVVYGGGCTNADTTLGSGDTLLVFDELANGLYDACTITPTDAVGNTGNTLAVTPFTVEVLGAGGNSGGGGGGGGSNNDTDQGDVAGTTTDETVAEIGNAIANFFGGNQNNPGNAGNEGAGDNGEEIAGATTDEDGVAPELSGDESPNSLLANALSALGIDGNGWWLLLILLLLAGGGYGGWMAYKNIITKPGA